MSEQPIPEMDIAVNRKSVKYSSSEQFRRVCWLLLKPLFRFSPRTWSEWRVVILRMMGARIGKNVKVYSSATIYYPWQLQVGDWASIGEHAYIYNLGLVTIGAKATISYRAHICSGTHDHSDPAMRLLRPPVTIDNQAWICTDAFVGPNVKVGEGAVVGARAVVVEDVEPWSIVAGNPARIIGQRTLQNIDLT